MRNRSPGGDCFSDFSCMSTETATFHGGITLASIIVLTALDWVARWQKRSKPLPSIRQQLRHALLSQHLPPLTGNGRLDTRTFLFACSILRSRSSCFSRSCRSGARKCRGTSLHPRMCTICRWIAPSGIFWTTISWIGRG